jgi:CheY-like chemotaxis protein
MLPPAETPMPEKNQPLVLCLDSNPRMLEILTKVLAPLSLTCLTSSQPEAALEQARQCRARHQRLQLIIVGWPLQGAWEMLHTLRAETQPAPPRIVILSAGDGRCDKALAANVAGADLFLEKPLEPEPLRREVSRLLALPLTGDVTHA